MYKAYIDGLLCVDIVPLSCFTLETSKVGKGACSMIETFFGGKCIFWISQFSIWKLAAYPQGEVVYYYLRPLVSLRSLIAGTGNQSRYNDNYSQ